uniref:Uncharacterized protein n=1 Tax=Anguilla anguilla TaxID=7936 RepID=A0A0E9VTS9_ANGAN
MDCTEEDYGFVDNMCSRSVVYNIRLVF